jgi:hypothetical protein
MCDSIYIVASLLSPMSKFVLPPACGPPAHGVSCQARHRRTARTWHMALAHHSCDISHIPDRVLPTVNSHPQMLSRPHLSLSLYISVYGYAR